MLDTKQQVDQWNQQVVLLIQQGRHGKALPLAREAAELARQYLGEEHPDTATSLDNLGSVLRVMGDLAGARPYCERALAIYLQALGEEHPDTATSLNNLGTLLLAMGDSAGARPYHERALAIRRQVLGEEHPGTAGSLDNFGGLLEAMGDLAGAQPYYERALAIREKALGPDHPDTARNLNNLGALLQAMGDLAGARPYYERALAIRRQVLGEEHPDTAQSLNNLGTLLQAVGDLAGARPYYERALAVRRQVLGEEHPDTAGSLNNLGALLNDMGDLAGARPYYERALAIRRQALGEEHPDTATTLDNFGILLQAMGDLAGARPYCERALAIRRQALGEEHPATATSLSHLGYLLEEMGDLAGARPYYNRALAIRCHALGKEHPDTAASLRSLGTLLVALRCPAEALPLLQQAAGIDDRMLGQIFTIGSDRQRAAFLRTVEENKHAFLSLMWQHFPQNPQAVRAALDLVLRRKAILAEAQVAQRDAVLGGKYPHLKPSLQRWSTLRMQIARKRLAGPGPEGRTAHEQHLDEWEQQRERLEAELARQVPEMNLEKKLRAADRRAVALALPEDVALVEFVHFHVCDFHATAERISDTEWRPPQRWKPASYLAFVLRSGKPDDVAMFDLGDAEPIDRLVAEFHAGIIQDGAARASRNMVRQQGETRSAATQALGERLRTAVFDKLQPVLGDRRQLLVSPDGALAFLPFGVLPAGDGRLLMDVYAISYVNTGRDVLRFAAPSTGVPADPLIVADPDFDLGKVGFWGRLFGRSTPPSTGAAAANVGRLSRDFDRSYHFGRLAGTRTEGQRVAALLGVKPWLDDAALEGRLKQACRSPRLLHLATHGFFLQDQPHDPNKDFRDLGVMGEQGRLSGPLPENPLLRSGLALAGANTWLQGRPLPDEAEDGLLTAEDVSGLDLLDTELVVLSACETGLGEVRTGEGVFGLQRAFILAGAKTLVMSLWSVPDEATRELMVNFYERILRGEPRADALHAAQNDLRRKHPEPYFWGAFVCLGNPGPLPPVTSGGFPTGGMGTPPA